MNSQAILENLSNSGFRISRVRKNLIEYLANCQKPHSVSELLSSFQHKIPTLNKTSLYRELTFLKGQGIVQEIEFGEGKKRYEINSLHHHHIVCLKCDSIEDVAIGSDLSKHEKQIVQGRGFQIKFHTLEFFGECRTCQL